MGAANCISALSVTALLLFCVLSYDHTHEVVPKPITVRQVFYIETISNPLLEIADIPAVAAFCQERGLTSVIDNTFASPAVIRCTLQSCNTNHLPMYCLHGVIDICQIVCKQICLQVKWFKPAHMLVCVCVREIRKSLRQVANQ